MYYDRARGIHKMAIIAVIILMTALAGLFLSNSSGDDADEM